MATITPKILKKNEKSNGTWLVLYRLTHNRKSRYIKTRHYVSKEDVVGKDDISMGFIIDHLSEDLRKYRKTIDKIEGIEKMSVDDVKEILIGGNKEIDFKKFVRYHIDRLTKSGRDTTARPFNTVLNSLNDFHPQDLYCSKITSKFLEDYERYLRRPKIIKRQQGSVMAEKETYVTDKGLHNHMAAFRTLFNAAKFYYNDEDTGRILINNNPFSKYRVIPKKNKKHKNISVEQIRMIRDYNPGSRKEHLSKNMFMLSFYLCGMNSVDIFKNLDRLKKIPDRLGYNRSKTANKREDDAYINVKIVPEAKEILKTLDIRESNMNLLNKNLSLGLISIREKLNIYGLTMLYARHSFATIARNDLNISKDDVALSLNHVSPESRITDTYLAPDWSKIDRVQDAVINKINEDILKS